MSAMNFVAGNKTMTKISLKTKLITFAKGKNGWINGTEFERLAMSERSIRNSTFWMDFQKKKRNYPKQTSIDQWVG